MSKKRILAVIMSVLMMLMMIPVSVFAEEADTVKLEG